MGAERGKLKKIHDDVEYYQHQVDGVRTMARMGSFILADDMGLGKSLQALTVAAIDFEKEWAERVLVVSPATLKWNWEAEIAEHTSFTCMVLDGSPAVRTRMLEEFAGGDTEILIVNYEQVRAHLVELNRMAFDIVIFDEAHYLKNPRAKRTKACLDLNPPREFMLTGSPVLNQVHELWTLLHLCDRQRFPTFYRFVNRYAVYGGYKNKQIVGVKNREELNKVLGEYMIRRRKEDVLDLPSKQRIVVKVDLSPAQRKLYKEAQEELELHLPDASDPRKLENALTQLLVLKQICGTTGTLIEGADDSHKLDRVVEMVEEIIESGEHVVVFTQFRAVQACLLDRLEALKIKTYALNGDTKKQDRVPIVQAWGASKKPAAMVAMLQVASVGLNMTAASKCIFVDKLWTPKLNEQAEDRLHRIGADQTKPIQIFEMICKGTVEDRVEQILRRKRKIFDSLIEEADWKTQLWKEMFAEDDED